MTSSAIDIVGVRELATTFGNGAKEIGNLAQAVIRKTALDIEHDAKAFVPVDTGNLKSSIGHSDLRRVGTSGTLQAEVGPTANYGVFVELGTSTQAPQAFMGPALDRNGPAFVAAMEQIVERATQA